MSIMPMPGMGGPPGAPPMGGPPGPAPEGGGGPEGILKMLAGLQQQPPPDGEQEALRDASMKIGMAMARIQMRSAKAARLLADALSKVQQAREALQQEGHRSLNAPPDLGFAGAGAPATPPMGGVMGG